MKQNDTIPAIQAGFRKGRCTTDHLVKLTSHIKRQKGFEEKKYSGLFFSLSFFNVKKAYDSVCGTPDYFIN